MKSNALKQPYFSAYPLKAVPVQDDNLSSSYIHINNGEKKRRFNNRLFVMPMADPYREEESSKEPSVKEKLSSVYMQSFDTDWYNHYE